MQELYTKTVVPTLQKSLGRNNTLSLPKIVKVSINVGIGSYIRSGNKDYQAVIDNVSMLCGQRPVVTLARKAISNFRLREQNPVGIAATLRASRMMDFVNRLVNVVLPRIRDFRGISVKGFDGQGNYSLGIKEVTVFPEVNPDNITRNHGVQITIQTSARNDYEGYVLLKNMGFPFKDELSPQS